MLSRAAIHGIICSDSGLQAYATMSPPRDPGRPAAGAAFERLVETMRTLRSPGGCAWDREQTLASLRPFVLEEAYEVVDAIDRGDLAGLKEEIGDLVLEAVFLAQVAHEQDAFEIRDALDSVCAKLVRRHPHVFGTGDEAAPTLTAADVKRQWEVIKADERAAAGRKPGALGEIPESLPALLRACRIGKRAATVGFDWTAPAEVEAKVDEELRELRAARAQDSPRDVEEELGDVLFAVANLARHLDVDPEAALRAANRKFTARFRMLEKHFRDRGVELRDASPADMDAEWRRIKDRE